MANRGRTTLSELDSDLLILDQTLKRHVELGMDSIIDVVQNITDYCPDDTDLHSEAKNTMLQYIGMETELKHYVKALNNIKAQDQNGEEEMDYMDLLKQNLQQQARLESAAPSSHLKYRKMEEKMAAGGSVAEQLEDLRNILVGGSEVDDVVLTQAEVNIKCPYSGQIMVNPVRNRKCGHVYDQEAIENHIKQRRSKAKCPVGGCINISPIVKADLEEHRDLKRYLTLLSKT